MSDILRIEADVDSESEGDVLAQTIEGTALEDLNYDLSTYGEAPFSKERYKFNFETDIENKEKLDEKLKTVIETSINGNYNIIWCEQCSD